MALHSVRGGQGREQVSDGDEDGPPIHVHLEWRAAACIGATVVLCFWALAWCGAATEHERTMREYIERVPKASN